MVSARVYTRSVQLEALRCARCGRVPVPQDIQRHNRVPRYSAGSRSLTEIETIRQISGLKTTRSEGSKMKRRIFDGS
jgi:hypothetical protein